MYSYTKVKKDFSYRNVKFKGIECYEGDGNSIEVTTTGTAQMIRQILKNKYPKIDGQGTWVKTRKFSGGNSIDVYLNRPPESIYNEINAYLKVFDSWAVNHRGEKREQKLSDDGIKISAYTSYLFVNNTPPYDSKESGQPAPDWDKILSESTPAPKSSGSSPKASWDKGELLRECGGWKVYKKTLPDGRVVFSAFKDKETAPNKADWNLIKGEIYTETGFKWGRFGNFEKWGNIEDLSVLDKLCAILTKYYGGGKEEPKKEELDEKELERFFEYVKDFYDGKFTDEEINYGISEYVKELNKGQSDWTWGGGDSTDRERVYNIMVWKREEEREKEGGVEIIVDGKFELKKPNDNEAMRYVLNSIFGGLLTWGELSEKMNVVFVTGLDNKRKLYVALDNYYYGSKRKIPSDFGNSLQISLADENFRVRVAKADTNNHLEIWDEQKGNRLKIIERGNDFFSIIDSNKKEYVKTIFYIKDSASVSPYELAKEIRSFYDTYFGTEKQEPKKVSREDVEKQIRALSYLAQKGNENATKQINALKYLLK